MTDVPPTPRRGRRVLAAAAGLGVLGLPLTSPSPQPSPSAASDRGTQLYQQSCASCHGQQGEGSQRGPALTGVGPADVDFQLSTGRMPLRTEHRVQEHREPVFSESDIRALVQHVASFPPGGGPPIPTVGGGHTRSGRELYLTYCSACHSAAGVGATLTNGRFAPSLFQATPTQIGEAVRVGPGLMPAFPSGVLTDAQVDDIAAYVDVLQNDRGDLDRGGWSLGRLGPFPEGAVAWVLGLGVLLLLARRLGSRAR
ncbi:cytochrome c [Couchioplanes caeruleus]|uniref:cytochrome bc1 complex diheme cytochrome c subunit n=1 Tax=Couchioplanes caeruleus TaxID=56438 RepID=UPI0020C0249E|nr:c-type cytochrome [Couchioplanes caeruleus]UQU62616.1 cytochrome c [Couchioplanes caeruleus]